MAALTEMLTHMKTVALQGQSVTIDSKAFIPYVADDDDMILLCEGPTPPTDGAAGFGKGCILIQNDSTSISTIVLFNVGTNAACNFDTLGAGAGGVPTSITVADASADTSMFVALFGDATGDLGPKTDAGISYNANTNVLTVAGGVTANVTGNLTGNVSGNVTGNLTGNVTGNTSGSAGNCTGNSVTATALETPRTIGGTSFNGTANIVPASIVVADTADTSCFVALFEEASGSLLPKTDPGLTYNAGTGMLTATGLTGPLTGNADTVTSAANDAENKTLYPAFVDGQTGSKSLETDVGLTYNPSTGMLTTAGVTAALTGNASTATTLETTRAIGGVNFNGSAAITPLQIEPVDCADAAGPFYPLLVDGLTGAQAAQTDAGITYNASTNALTATTFVGALTGNATTATTLATARAIGGVDFNGSAPITPLQVEPVDSANDDAAFYLLIVDGATGAQAVETDTGLTFNPSTNILSTTRFSGAVAKAPTAYNDDATPSVVGATGVKVTATAAPLALTGFDDGVAGQFVVLTVVSTGGAVTATDGANFQLVGSANFAMSTGDTLTMYTGDGTVWTELCRADNT